ncbi:MAG TPA: CDP-archaeol synthase [Chloroflexota bacterium]|nr:CDP-archaeol synthase [Chloroflexota bacterium]
MTWRRILPAVVLGPLLLWAASLPLVPAYVAVVGLCAAVGSGEVYRLLQQAGFRPLWALGILLAVVLALDAGLTGWRLAPHVLGVVTLVVLAWAAFRPEPGSGVVDWALTIAPALYVGGLLAYYMLLRGLPHGPFWVQVVLACTWAADIGAYLVGRRWGRTKLAPTLSPAKSVEGALAGVVAAVALAGLIALVASGAPAPPLVFLGLGVLIALAGILGDLAESFIKRQLGAKDASGLLLGHGGLLDRLDSLLAAGVVAYYYLVVINR